MSLVSNRGYVQKNFEEMIVQLGGKVLLGDQSQQKYL